MGLFSDPSDLERRENLKKLEDKRVAFAAALDQRGFKPETMLFAQSNNGGFVAVSRFGGEQWVIVSPGFGTNEEFVIDHSPRFPVRKEEVLVKSEGMGGFMGFGKKGEHGVDYVITLNDGTEARLPIVFGRSCWAEFKLNKNPLLSTRRRRNNANLVWDLKPVDNGVIGDIIRICDGYLLND